MLVSLLILNKKAFWDDTKNENLWQCLIQCFCRICKRFRPLILYRMNVSECSSWDAVTHCGRMAENVHVHASKTKETLL